MKQTCRTSRACAGRLESTLFSSSQVFGLVRKQEGMGLSMGYQMAKVLKDEATAMKLMVVSGPTKELHYNYKYDLLLR